MGFFDGRLRLSVLLFCAGLCGTALRGQQITGSLTGSVRDTSGAAVVRTMVRLTNVGTGATQSAPATAAAPDHKQPAVANEPGAEFALFDAFEPLETPAPVVQAPDTTASEVVP